MIGSAQRAETGIPQNEVAPAPKKQEAPKELSEEQIKTREKLAKFAAEQKAKDRAKVAKETPLAQSRAKELAKPSGHAREMPAITQTQIDAHLKTKTDRVVDTAPRTYNSKDNAGEMPAITQAQIDAWKNRNRKPGESAHVQTFDNIDPRPGDYLAPETSDRQPVNTTDKMQKVSPLSSDEKILNDSDWTYTIPDTPATQPEPKKQGFIGKFFGKKAA